MRFAAVLVSLTACTFSTNVNNSGDNAPPEEAGVTGNEPPMPDARLLDGCTTFSTVINTCAVGAYGNALTINGNRRYNTETHILSDDNGNNPSMPNYAEISINGNPITFIVVDGFTISMMSRLRVSGARAFGVVSSDTITIIGTIDAASGGAGNRTAAACGASAGGAGTNGTDGAGGGGGGGYRGDGGMGGKGDNNGTPRDGGSKGTKVNLAATVIGGCPGGRGGNNGGGQNGGAGGLGGGAVFLTSAAAMTITGIINVGGGGGLHGSATDGGAGGGGSGGQILAEATTLTMTGILAANGGAGGGGAGGTNGTDGSPGVAAASAAPAGQTTSGGGSSGSVGAAGGNLDGIQPADANGGAGGAGGGVGYISLITQSTPGGIISPSTTPWP